MHAAISATLSLALLVATSCGDREQDDPAKTPTPVPTGALPATPPTPEPRPRPALPFAAPTVHGKAPPFEPAGPVVTISDLAIAVDGQSVVAVKAGDVVPEERTEGAFGVVIPRLTRYLEAWQQSVRPKVVEIGGDKGVVGVLAQPTTPFRLLFEVVTSAEKAGYRRFAFIVEDDQGAVGGLMIQLPEAISSASLNDQIGVVRDGKPTPPQKDAPLGLAVSVTKTQLVLWSISGQEGTIDAPRLGLFAGPPGVPMDLAKLTTALADIAKRRWGGAARPPATREIILQADLDLPWQSVVDVMGALRADPAGAELFPDILLSAGFQ